MNKDSSTSSGSLTFGERNSRLLLVISSIGLVIYVLRVLFTFLFSSYQAFYYSKEKGFFLGSEHILVPLISASSLIIILLGIKYCISEFPNFSNFERVGLRKSYEEQADKKFRVLVGNLFLHIILLLVISISTILYFENKYILIAVLIIFLGITILARKKFRQALNIFLDRFFPQQNLIVILLPWCLICIILMLIGFGSFGLFIKGSFEVKYSAKDLNLYFKNKVPDLVNIFVLDKDKNITYQTKITKNELEEFSAAVSMGNNNQMNLLSLEESKVQILSGNSVYEYRKKVDLENYFTEGINYVVISFEIRNALGTSKQYRLLNQLNKFGTNTVEINKNSFSIDL